MEMKNLKTLGKGFNNRWPNNEYLSYSLRSAPLNKAAWN